jgi:hypothetical protein
LDNEKRVVEHQAEKREAEEFDKYVQGLAPGLGEKLDEDIDPQHRAFFNAVAYADEGRPDKAIPGEFLTP